MFLQKTIIIKNVSHPSTDFIFYIPNYDYFLNCSVLLKIYILLVNDSALQWNYFKVPFWRYKMFVIISEDAAWQEYNILRWGRRTRIPPISQMLTTK